MTKAEVAQYIERRVFEAVARQQEAFAQAAVDGYVRTGPVIERYRPPDPGAWALAARLWCPVSPLPLAPGAYGAAEYAAIPDTPYHEWVAGVEALLKECSERI